MAGAKKNRGGQGGSKTAQNRVEPRELTDEEMERELKEHFAKVDDLLARFMAQRGEGKTLKQWTTKAFLTRALFRWKSTPSKTS